MHSAFGILIGFHPPKFTLSYNLQTSNRIRQPIAYLVLVNNTRQPNMVLFGFLVFLSALLHSVQLNLGEPDTTILVVTETLNTVLCYELLFIIILIEVLYVGFTHGHLLLRTCLHFIFRLVILFVFLTSAQELGSNISTYKISDINETSFKEFVQTNTKKVDLPTNELTKKNSFKIGLLGMHSTPIATHPQTSFE